MDFMSLIYMMVLVAAGWFWLNSIRVLEIARSAGKQACTKADVQFLDDTVSGIQIRLVRNTSGRRVLQRTYRFEYSETGNNRIEGRVIMLGEMVESVTMHPYLRLI
jgi:hypothetical protein